MRDSNGSRAKRITAGIIVLLLLVIVLFSSFYVAAEAHHDCTGEDCPVCACIRLCDNTLHQIGDGGTALTACLIPVIIILLYAAFIVTAVSHETPVSRKVRLNN